MHTLPTPNACASFARFPAARLWLALLLFSVAGPVAGQGVQLPSWPQQFSVQGPEQRSFGFPVTQPGRVAVDIQVKGAPIVAVLQGPASQGIQQQGSGTVRLASTATSQDVQKGVVWIVTIRLAQPAPPQQGGTARGTIGVQQPPVDQAQLEAATRSFIAQAEKARPQREAALAQAGARLKAQQDASLMQHQQQLQQMQAQRQAVLTARAQPMVDQLRARASSGVSTRGLSPDELSTPLPDPVTRERTPTKQPLPPPPPPAPSPVITSLNVAQGQPGDTVLIFGSNFGTARGEVHFLVAPGMDRLAPTDFVWTDTQIFARVPDQRGIVGFNGIVSIKRPDQVASNLLPFKFIPVPERRLIVAPGDYTLQEFNGVSTEVFFWSGQPFVARNHGFCFWTPSGSDKFFNNTRLQNSWKVIQPPVINVTNIVFKGGSAYAVDMRVGTDSPYIAVNWWVTLEPFCYGSMHYTISIPIEGPAGTPDGVVVQR